MRKPARRALGIAVAGVAVIALVAPTMAAAPVTDRGSGGQVRRIDNHPGPLTERQNARRKAAQELILSGKASPNADGVVQLAEDKFFQAALTGEGQVFTILSEFGDQGTKKLGLVPGPLHNEIAKPNRETVDGQPNADYDESLPYDNFRQWKANFNEGYYHDLFYGAGDSFADFYEKQSSGAYTVAGDVGNQSNGHDGWVKVPGNASTYGDNAVEDFGGAWQFIEDSGNAWYADALAALGSRRPSRPISASSTSGIETTSTTTATSTSRTATSTTSRRSMPGRARTPAAAHRAPTRSGRIAGTSIRPTSA